MQKELEKKRRKSEENLVQFKYRYISLAPIYFYIFCITIIFPELLNNLQFYILKYALNNFNFSLNCSKNTISENPIIAPPENLSDTLEC